MNQISPFVNNVLGTISHGFKMAGQQLSQWANHSVRRLQLIPQQMQQNPYVAVGVIATTNIVFFFAIRFFVNRLDQRIEKKNKSLDSEQRTIKHIFLGAILGGSVLAFNVFLSKSTQYPLNKPMLGLITTAAIGGRILLNQLGKYWTREENSIEEGDVIEKKADRPQKTKEERKTGDVNSERDHKTQETKRTPTSKTEQLRKDRKQPKVEGLNEAIRDKKISEPEDENNELGKAIDEKVDTNKQVSNDCPDLNGAIQDKKISEPEDENNKYGMVADKEADAHSEADDTENRVNSDCEDVGEASCNEIPGEPADEKSEHNDNKAVDKRTDTTQQTNHQLALVKASYAVSKINFGSKINIAFANIFSKSNTSTPFPLTIKKDQQPIKKQPKLILAPQLAIKGIDLILPSKEKVNSVSLPKEPTDSGKGDDRKPIATINNKPAIADLTSSSELSDSSDSSEKKLPSKNELLNGIKSISDTITNFSIFNFLNKKN